jgi:hypothetical protein
MLFLTKEIQWEEVTGSGKKALIDHMKKRIKTNNL